MPRSTSVCRICLAVNVRMFGISGELHLMYEKITNTALYTAEKKPIVACYICNALLKKCYQLMLISSKAENVLNAILDNHNKITVGSVSQFDRRANGLNWSLINTKPECYQNLAPSLIQVKTEPEWDHAVTEIDNEETYDFPQPADLADIKSESEEVSKSPTQQYSTLVDVTADEESVGGFPQPLHLPSVKIKPEENPSSPAQCNTKVHMLAEKVGAAETSKAEKRTEAEVTANKKHNSQQVSPTSRTTRRCKMCKRRFPSSHDMRTHLKTHSDEKPYQCTVCNKQFKRNDLLLRHSRSHSGEKPHECIICRKHYKRTEHLKRHLKSHSSDEAFDCYICKHKVKGTEEIMSHIRSHSVEKVYECNECQRRFTQKSNLVHHFRSHMDYNHKCCFCQRWFKHSNNLSRHLKTQHWRETTQSQSQFFLFK